MSAGAAAVLLAGRLLFVWFYAASAVNHVRNADRMGQTARRNGFPFPVLAGVPAGLWVGAASVSVAFGVFPDAGSLMLLAFLVPATFYFHGYWRFEDPAERRTQHANFRRNVAWMGVCLAFFAMFGTIDDGLRFTLTSALFSLE